jgi:uncharacterized protein YjiS (DUF1127 family)
MREAASFIASQSTADSAGVLSQLIDRAVRFLQARLHRRAALRLIDMDDHLLNDIGIARTDVQRALNQPFATDPTLELQAIALRNRRRGWRG